MRQVLSAFGLQMPTDAKARAVTKNEISLSDFSKSVLMVNKIPTAEVPSGVPRSVDANVRQLLQAMRIIGAPTMLAASQSSMSVCAIEKMWIHI